MEKEVLSYTQNRELSWLRFNQRVLEEAQDESVPLLERMKFVSIFTSNLDEFFMIRVGSLYDLAEVDPKQIDKKSGMTPKEQLEAVYEAVAPLYKERDKTYADIKKQLAVYGIRGLSMKDAKTKERKYIKKYFKEQILPVLSPQVVDVKHPFPHLLNNQIYVIANLKQENSEDIILGIVPVPSYLPEILLLPGEGMRYIQIEKVMMHYLGHIFEQYQIFEPNAIRVTRNADVSPNLEALEDQEDFRYIMKKALHKRRRMGVVRMETAEPLKKEVEKYLCSKLNMKQSCIFRTKAPMQLEFFSTLTEMMPASMRQALTEEPFVPQQVTSISEKNVMAQVKKQDLLLSYPYESMEPFLQLIKEAAVHPEVMTIKITIYRLAKKSRLVEYLCAAAENGKEVTVLIELRARFDEQNNIDWSERMEEAGCRVIYGLDGYKVHSKICLITLRNRNEIRYITQIGTGNYNEKTAKLYTDYSLITAHQGIGRDAAAFFKNMAIGNVSGSYQHLLVSPTSLKQRIFRLIDEEIKKGSKGRIVMKMNSVTDLDFMKKISEASKAGVRIHLLVRGICCILPGIPEETEHVSVTSIVGRFLEHSRVFVFGTGEQQKIYISSADMMTRNTQRRVEVACPVYDPFLRKKLIHCLKVMLADHRKARRMLSDGTYCRKKEGEGKICAQEYFMREAMYAKQPVRTVAKKKFSSRSWSVFKINK